jgi:hypothetical protein
MLLCGRIRETLKKRHRKLLGEYSFTISDSIETADHSAWDYVNGNRNLFLSADYLQLLESQAKSNYFFRYIIVYDKKVPLAIAYFQIIDFTTEIFGDLVTAQLSSLQSTRAKLFQRYVSKTKGHVILRLVTLGNNFVSGEHGFAFAKEIRKEMKFKLLQKVTEVISKEEKLRGRISATLVKDFFVDSVPERNALKHDNFIEFSVEPNMIIEVPEEVTSLSDYIALFSKKYRKRTRDIFKAGESIEKRVLTAEDVEKLNRQIFSLYENVYNNAKFKLVKLPADYFKKAKKVFGERFIVNGFFRDNELVAFNSAFLLGNCEVEAHFIGFDYSMNKEFELYQNILYNLVETAITHKCSHINLGRTAAEIKSTVGAKAQNLICFLKPQNTVSKLVMRPFISYLQPGEWVPRNPFKEEAFA